MNQTFTNAERAKKLIKRVSSFGISRKDAETKAIVSIGTQRSYISCVKLYLDWRDDNGLPTSTQDRKTDLLNYLEEQSEIYQQKTLDQHRMALNAAFLKKLQPIKSHLDTLERARDYRLNEVLLLINNLQSQNAISILLCFYCGLRAHELATLQREHETTRSSVRKWSEELFTEIKEFQIYIVTGKGGLRRYVAIPNQLVKIIESRRLNEPRKVRDRQIFYWMNYDLGFGQALSQSFTRSSQKNLNWSTGLHGLRHSYAKNRLITLVKHGLSLDTAKLIVSQELGHFRPSIVNCYLR